MLETQLRKALDRGVANVYPTPEKLEEALRNTPDKLTFYYGIDPTAPFVHLGHTVPIRKLEQLRQLGCKVILLIGNFTATIGDPTDKLAARKALSVEEVEANAQDYLKLISTVLNLDDPLNPVEIRRNNDWWSRMTFVDFMNLAQKVTVQQLLERDMFQERLKEGKPIHLHEFTYPLLQGYDGVVMEVDGEVGGNDQTFNMLMGRELSRSILQKEKYVISVKLLADPSGKKMGKSEGNAVPLDASAAEMYGVIMSWPDNVISSAFELLTDVEAGQVEEWENNLHPKEFKGRLATEIVSTFHSGVEAKKAAQEFDQAFGKNKDAGVLAQDFILDKQSWKPIDLLVATKLADSKSDARRVLEQGGMKINGQNITDVDQEIEISEGDVVQRGKRQIVRINFS